MIFISQTNRLYTSGTVGGGVDLQGGCPSKNGIKWGGGGVAVSPSKKVGIKKNGGGGGSCVKNRAGVGDGH